MRSGYVAIIGRPNSGKSTLLNRILGERLSIVTPKAQTTRRRIVGIHNMAGAQIVFLDTPGYHDSTKPMNRYMMDIVDRSVADADVVCIVVDVKEGAEADAPAILKAAGQARLVIAVNKIDLVLDRSWENVADAYRERFKGAAVLAVSAKNGTGVEELVGRFVEMLPEGEPFYPDDIYTEHPVRFLVSEIVREQIFELTHQEIPYSVAVEVEDYREEPKIHKIEAAIIVDKESQKGMLIGSGGKMIKRIGELSRARIEQLVGCKVFLKLYVRVEKDWTKDRNSIKKLLG